MSHGMVQMPLPSVYFAVGTASTYSFDSAATTFLDLFYNIQLDAVRIIYIAVGITHSNNLSTKCLSLLYCVDCYITGTGYQNSLAGQLFAIVL